MPKLNDAIRLYMGAQQADAAHLGGVLVWTAPAAPVNTVAPVITGSAVIGSQLTCSTGSWDGTAPITYSYQWRADGSPISGATANTYTTVQAEGVVITCTVTATNSVGSAAQLSSNSVTLEDAPPVGLATFDGMATNNAGPNGRVLTRASGAAVASAFSSTALTGKHYIEMVASRTTGMAGIALYNGSRTDIDTLTSTPPGQWYNEPGMSSSLLGWSTTTMANTNLPRAGSYNQSHGSAGTEQRHAICVDATDPENVAVWVRTPALPPPGTASWLGGGDPALGTSPSFLMDGEGPTLIGATTESGSVEWVEPGDQLWGAPAGFTPM